MSILLSIHVGKPRHHTLPGESGTWYTGYVKEQVFEPVWAGRTNLEGDGQGNLKYHGGPDKAILMYGAEHYEAWRAEGRDLPHGAFAENLTVSGVNEDTVCIGDRFKIGEAELQVSQPRYPCTNINRRWEQEDLMKRVLATWRTGWYLRVTQEGQIAPGDAVTLLARPHPEYTVRRAHELLVGRAQFRAEAEALAQLPVLSDAWREVLRRP